MVVLLVTPAADTGPVPVPGERVSIGDTVVDLVGRRVLGRRRIASLTLREVDLLTVLVRERGRTVSRDELLVEVWRGEAVKQGAPRHGGPPAPAEDRAGSPATALLVAVRRRGFPLA